MSDDAHEIPSRSDAGADVTPGALREWLETYEPRSGPARQHGPLR